QMGRPAMNLVNRLVNALVAPTERLRLQVPRALVASAVAACLDFGLLVCLGELFGWAPVPAAVVGYLAGGVLQCFLCAVWVFPSAPANAATGFVAFTVLSLVGLGITSAVIGLVHDLGHFPYPLAKCVALGLAFTWNFFSRKLLLFGPGADKGLEMAGGPAGTGEAAGLSLVES